VNKRQHFGIIPQTPPPWGRAKYDGDIDKSPFPPYNILKESPVKGYPGIRSAAVVPLFFTGREDFPQTDCRTGPVRQGKAAQYGGRYAVQAVCA